jgi:hypothetical protein
MAFRPVLFGKLHKALTVVFADIHAASRCECVVVIIDLYDMKEPVDLTIALRYFAYRAR